MTDTDTPPEYVSEWDVVPPGDSAHILQNDQCSTSRLQTSTIPRQRQWKEAKIRLVPKLPALKQYADYCSIPITLYHTNYVQNVGAKRSPHIPLSDVSRPAAQSGILGSICFQPQWLHISCHHLPTSHRYHPAAIQSFCRRHLIGLPRRSIPPDTARCCPSWLSSTCRCLSSVYNWMDFFSGHSHHIPCLVETSRAREASRPASYRARALDQPPTLSQQLISDRSTPTTYSS